LFIFGHNSPAAKAREMFKLSKHAENFIVSILKNLEVLDLSFFVGDVIIGGSMEFFG